MRQVRFRARGTDANPTRFGSLVVDLLRIRGVTLHGVARAARCSHLFRRERCFTALSRNRIVAWEGLPYLPLPQDLAITRA